MAEPEDASYLDARPQAQDIDITVESREPVENPRERPCYTLDELLAKCNLKAGRSEQAREWLCDEPVGGELI
jgi:antitoxin ChpS